MKKVSSFTILGNPKAQKRHRYRNVETKSGKHFVQSYDPSLSDKADFKAEMKRYAPEHPLTGPLRLDLCFVFPRPNSHFGTGSNSNKLKPSAPEHHISKPDRDNLDKIIMDSMTGIFWKDDCQVCQGFIKKVWGEKPMTIVHLYLLT